MIGKIKALFALAAGVGLVLGLGLATLAGPALATGDGTVVPINNCLNRYEIKKWYGHDDEAAIFANVSSTALGLRFNGPSLAHRAITATKLADLPENVIMTTVVTAETTGRVPDFKIRTDEPFSTLTKNPAGWWSSKILPGDPGGMDHPLPGPADFEGLTLTKVAPVDGVPVTYTAATVGADVQLGYANDTGNVGIVRSVVYMGKVYAFACPKWAPTPGPSQTSGPTGSPTATPTATASPTGSPTATPTATATAGPTGSPTTTPPSPTVTVPPTDPPVGGGNKTPPELALTGAEGGTNWPMVIAGVGTSLLVIGVALLVVSRRRFEA